MGHTWDCQSGLPRNGQGWWFEGSVWGGICGSPMECLGYGGSKTYLWDNQLENLELLFVHHSDVLLFKDQVPG